MTDQYNFEITKGQDYSQEILIRDSETHEPINIANMEFHATCRDHVNSDLELFNFVMTKRADPALGRLTMFVSREFTTELTESAGVYDMFVTYTAEDRREPYMSGKITFKESQTDEVIVREPVTYVLLVGFDMANDYGYASTRIVPFGEIEPTQFYGVDVIEIVAVNGTDEVYVQFLDGLQFKTAETVTLKLVDETLPELVLPWDGTPVVTGTKYTIIDPDWALYIINNYEATITVTLEIDPTDAIV